MRQQFGGALRQPSHPFAPLLRRMRPRDAEETTDPPASARVSSAPPPIHPNTTTHHAAAVWMASRRTAVILSARSGYCISASSVRPSLLR